MDHDYTVYEKAFDTFLHRETPILAWSKAEMALNRAIWLAYAERRQGTRRMDFKKRCDRVVNVRLQFQLR